MYLPKVDIAYWCAGLLDRIGCSSAWLSSSTRAITCIYRVSAPWQACGLQRLKVLLAAWNTARLASRSEVMVYWCVR